jgi:DNA topoisomerase-2
MNSPKIMKKSKNVKKSAGNALDKKYQKKTERERVLIRPDTYIGSNDLIVNESWVFNKESKRMERKTLEYNPGFLKIFDEILTNASDHSVEFPGKVTKIDVVVNQDEGFISVYNNGPGIDIGIHKEHKCYYPELIFANLGAGTNYNDEEERLKGGRNGLGAKLAAIFSTKFDIETVSKGEIYNQSYKDNLSKIEKPKIKKTSKKEGTKITFYPDFKKLHITRISDSMLTLIEKRTMDIAACTNKDVNVTFNKEKLTIKEFENYVDLFCGTKKDTKRVIITRDRWKIIFILNPFDSFNQVSYVNGISTNYGGTHIDHVIRPVIKRTIEQLSAKHKDVDIKNNYVKDNIMVFIKSLIVNPSFKSQTKEELTTSVQNFGSRCDVTDQEIKQIIKLGIDKNVLAIAQAKSQKALSATDGKKKKKLTGVPKLNDANDAGGKESQSCTLIVTEGDSAATFAISGLAKIGKDKYGVFPLKGKPLNVRKSTTAQIGKNSEIINLKLILGLQHGKKYKDVKSLKADMRYGKIMILTDQDTDGSHIKGLLVNLFHYSWPLLVKESDFITCLQTPIVKIRKGNIVKSFYNLIEYENWRENENTKGWNAKYYKGLGTSSAAEARECFDGINNKLVKYTVKTPEDDESIDLAFNKDRPDDRKVWIKTSTEKNLFLDNTLRKVPIKQFFDEEFVQFSIADNVRSIPNLMDGLKPSQRKVLFVCLKNNIKKETKVIELTGEIMKTAAYHHGDASLNDTIISLSFDFVGSNNINLLSPSGQLGTRLQGGKDASSARYISAFLNPVTRSIFLPEDDEILNYLEDDGTPIEPEFYWPIVCTLLMNGTSGIGTGYSTDIPCYNPLEIINITKELIKDDEYEIPKMTPWYKGFTGTIEEKPNSENFISKGVWKRVSRGTIHITELPIGMWTRKYLEKLDKFVEEGKVFDSSDNCNDVDVDITIKMSPVELDKWINDNSVYEELGLTSTIKASNMTVFDHKKRITPAAGPDEIIYKFYLQREKGYKKRYQYLLDFYDMKIKQLNAKLMFIRGIIDGKIKVFRVPKNEIIVQLEQQNFLKNEDSYEYLLSMRIHSFTEEKMKELEKELGNMETLLNNHKSKTHKEIWMNDIKNLEEKLKKIKW